MNDFESRVVALEKEVAALKAAKEKAAEVFTVQKTEVEFEQVYDGTKANGQIPNSVAAFYVQSKDKEPMLLGVEISSMPGNVYYVGEYRCVYRGDGKYSVTLAVYRNYYLYSDKPSSETRTFTATFLTTSAATVEEI